MLESRNMPRLKITKDYILENIRRTTKENGGVPLGSRSFFRETGIKESDWKGKLWVRWSDVVREAGFEPNEFSSAFDETLALEKFIGVMRELGRFPIIAELRLKKRSDPELPNSSVYARIGTKPQLARKIEQYCIGRAGYEDVAAMCKAVSDSHRSDSRGKTTSVENIGFVYLVKSGRFYKVGKSNSAGRRAYELAIQLPEKATTVHTIRTDDPSGIEEYWHKRFAAKRKNGEWFELDSDDLAAFKRRKFM
jgi:hypothetical protein